MIFAPLRVGGPNSVLAPVSSVFFAFPTAVQSAHAVLQSREALAGFSGDVLVLYADVPFVTAETMRAMLDRLHSDDAPSVVVLGFEPADALRFARASGEVTASHPYILLKDRNLPLGQRQQSFVLAAPVTGGLPVVGIRVSGPVPFVFAPVGPLRLTVEGHALEEGAR